MKPLLFLKKVKVVRGSGRGKKIGVPTINLSPTSIGDLCWGVYVCRVLPPFEYWGILHFGPRPTFDEVKPSFEIYLFDFDKNLEVPKTLDVEIYSFIRKIKRFESAGEMVEGIKHDILVAQKITSDFRKKN